MTIDKTTNNFTFDSDFFDNTEFKKVDFPNSIANNFLFDMKMFLTNKKCTFNLFKDWTNDDHNVLIIEFTFDNKISIDWLELFLFSKSKLSNITYAFKKEHLEHLGYNSNSIFKRTRNFPSSFSNSGFLEIDLRKMVI